MNLIGVMIPASGPWTSLWTLWAAGALWVDSAHPSNEFTQMAGIIKDESRHDPSRGFAGGYEMETLPGFGLSGAYSRPQAGEFRPRHRSVQTSVQAKSQQSTGCRLVGTVKGTKLWAGDCVPAQPAAPTAAEPQEPEPRDEIRGGKQ